MSTLIHLVLFGLFCPLWFYSVHYVHFNHIQSTLVLFGPVCPLRSYLVPFYPFCPLHSCSVPFSPIQSILSLFHPFYPFGPLCSIWSNSVHLITSILFCPLQSIFVHLQNGKRHIWVERKTSFLYNQYNYYLLSL